MARNTTNINIRMDADLKAQADKKLCKIFECTQNDIICFMDDEA